MFPRTAYEAGYAAGQNDCAIGACEGEHAMCPLYYLDRQSEWERGYEAGWIAESFSHRKAA